MAEYDDVQLDADEKFEILPVALDTVISMDDVDAILNRYIIGTKSFNDEFKIMQYVVQLAYKSGVRQISYKEVAEKLELLIVDKELRNLQDAGVITLEMDETGATFGLLTEKGKKQHEANLQKGRSDTTQET